MDSFLTSIFTNKMSEMQKVSEVFKLNLNYYQRVAHKKLSQKSDFLVFQVSQFSPGGTIYVFPYYRIFLGYVLTKIRIFTELKK